MNENERLKSAYNYGRDSGYADGFVAGYKEGVKDAKPKIIYCKDCRHNGSFDTDCPINWNGKEFCSFAERRTDE